jgi:hypothetical protein
LESLPLAQQHESYRAGDMKNDGTIKDEGTERLELGVKCLHLDTWIPFFTSVMGLTFHRISWLSRLKILSTRLTLSP